MNPHMPLGCGQLSPGRRLQHAIAVGAGVHATAGDDDLREIRARQAATRFLEDAKDHIIQALRHGKEPEPFVLGIGPASLPAHEAAACAFKADQWPWDTTQVPYDHEYRPMWDSFVRWADNLDLAAWLECVNDGRGTRSWRQLRVKPASRLDAQPDTALVSASVLLPTAILSQFGSGQAYLAHLQSKAGLG